MPRSIGTVDNPLQDLSSMNIARSIIDDRFTTDGKCQGIYEYKGDFWIWNGKPARWQVINHQFMEDCVWLWVSECYEPQIVKGKVAGTKKIDYSSSRVRDVVRCIEALTRLPSRKIPCWIGGGVNINPDFCIGLSDVIVDVLGSVKSGGLLTIPRTEAYFDCQTIPVALDMKAECPLWNRTVEQWSGGDPRWQCCLERELGYGCMAYREYAKWFMHYGLIRGGKGTIEHIRRILTGEYAYMGLRMRALGKNFGLHKLSRARTLVVSEVVELDGASSEEASGLLKNVLGRDPVDLDRKMVDAAENVVSGAMVVMLGNKIPNLPNEGRGLSSKMVPLNFDVSFEGRENPNLKFELEAELSGIVARIVTAAIELVAEPDSKLRFPITEGGTNAIHKYHALNNPADSFVHWGFSKNREGFVETEQVWSRYLDFCESMKVRAVARNQFNNWLELNNTWGVHSARPHGMNRVFKGMSMKAVPSFSEEWV